MNLIRSIKQVIYNFVFNGFEFIFFFTNYWWWKMQFLLIKHYWNLSGYGIYQNEKDKSPDLGEENFAFGETTALSTRLLLENVEIDERDVIYDLGSGRGVFLLSAYFLFNLKGVGIEIFDTYVEKSRQVRNAMKTGSVFFQQGNAAETDLTEADLVYVTATSYQKHVREEIIENLKKTYTGTTIIFVHYKLPEEDFVLFDEGYYPFTWGADKVYFYRKK